MHCFLPCKGRHTPLSVVPQTNTFVKPLSKNTDIRHHHAGYPARESSHASGDQKLLHGSEGGRSWSHTHHKQNSECGHRGKLCEDASKTTVNLSYTVKGTASPLRSPDQHTSDGVHAPHHKSRSKNKPNRDTQAPSYSDWPNHGSGQSGSLHTCRRESQPSQAKSSQRKQKSQEHRKYKCDLCAIPNDEHHRGLSSYQPCHS